MIDDEERQRIAGRLRYRASIWQTAYDYGACPEPYSAGLMRVLRDEVTDAVGIDRLSPPDRILDRLAELVDRPECENLPAKTNTPDSADLRIEGEEWTSLGGAASPTGCAIWRPTPISMPSVPICAS